MGDTASAPCNSITFTQNRVGNIPAAGAVRTLSVALPFTVTLAPPLSLSMYPCGSAASSIKEEGCAAL